MVVQKYFALLFFSPPHTYLHPCVLLIFAMEDPNISLVAVNIAALILMSRTAIRDVYKKLNLSIWENFFFLNLIILSLMILYIRTSGGNQAALVYTAVGITFAQYLSSGTEELLYFRRLSITYQLWYWPQLSSSDSFLVVIRTSGGNQAGLVYT